jgi:hypothetical protein
VSKRDRRHGDECRPTQGGRRTNTTAVGEACESKAGALNGIDSIRRNAADAALDDTTEA